MREPSFQRHDHESQQRVDADRDQGAGATQPLHTRVSRPLQHEGGECDREREPDGSRVADEFERAERERRNRGHGGEWNRELATGDLCEFSRIKPPTAIDAFAEAVRIDVGDPDHQYGRGDDCTQLPQAGVPFGARGERGHHDDRAVDRPRDPGPGAEDDSFRRVLQMPFPPFDAGETIRE